MARILRNQTAELADQTAKHIPLQSANLDSAAGSACSDVLTPRQFARVERAASPWRRKPEGLDCCRSGRLAGGSKLLRLVGRQVSDESGLAARELRRFRDAGRDVVVKRHLG